MQLQINLAVTWFSGDTGWGVPTTWSYLTLVAGLFVRPAGNGYPDLVRAGEGKGDEEQKRHSLPVEGLSINSQSLLQMVTG